MKDKFNREINYLRISVTDLCDLRCKYCMGEKGVQKLPHDSIMSIERIKEVTEAFSELGITKVRITGGEPLVRKGIVDIVKSIRSIQGIKEISMTTNGSKLFDYAESLKRNGLDRLNISLDTLRPDRYRLLTRVGDIKNVIKGIDKAIEVGFTNIKINVVLLKGFNDDEFDDFITFASEKSLTVRFIELMPIGESISIHKTSYLSNEKFKDDKRLEFVCDDGVSSLYQIKGTNGYIGFISPLSNRFCKDCNRIRLTADGKIKPCLHSFKEIDVNGYRGEELKKMLEDAILAKPEEHHLENGNSDSNRGMNAIGG